MSYREKLQKYKKNELSKEEQISVAEDIEKQDAISEYLTEQLEDEMDYGKSDRESGGEENPAGKASSQEKDFEAYVKKSIRRSFRRMGVCVCGIILAVVLFIQFGLSPLISKFYYNPSKNIEVSYDGGNSLELTNQMGRDLAVYSEVNLPGRNHDSVRAIPLGYGKYDITLNQTAVYAGMRRYGIGGQIERGHLKLYEPDFLNGVSSNLFANYGMEENSGLSYEEQLKAQEENGEFTWYYGKLDYGKQAIEELEEDKIYRAYVTFKKRLDFEEINQVIPRMITQGMTTAAEMWQGVCVGEDNSSMSPIGYNYPMLYDRITLTEEEREKYPELSLPVTGADGNVDWNATYEKITDEEVMTKHFTSLLRYLIDQPEFMQMMGEASGRYFGKEGLKIRTMKDSSAIDYVEKNGLHYFGVVCLADKEGMLKMLEDEDILAVVALDGE